jgi:hypothetical protein
MWSRHRLSLGMGFVVIASAAALTGSFGATAAPEPDKPSGEITLLAPCDAEEHPFAVKKLVSDMRTTFKLGPGGTVFASSATVTADADGSVFVLTLKIEQGGKVVSAGHMQTILNKGESGNLATLCAVIPARDTYSVSADVRVVGAIKALDSKNCRYTAP